MIWKKVKDVWDVILKAVPLTSQKIAIKKTTKLLQTG